MTWSYGPTYTTDKDIIRDLVRDTDSANPLATDEQIGKYMTGGVLAQSNVYLAAAMVADEIAGNLSGASSISAGGTSVTFRDASSYAKLAASLRARSAKFGGGVTAFAGGISRSAKETQTDNTDHTTPSFSRSMGDRYPDRVAQPSTDERYGVWE